MSYQETFVVHDEHDGLQDAGTFAPMSTDTSMRGAHIALPSAYGAAILPFPATSATLADVTDPHVTDPHTAPARPSRVYRSFGKRAFDLICILAAAPVWLPIIAICALLIARDGHNPFYFQNRVGRNGKIFRMIKLRSMVPHADAKLEAHLAENPEARAEWNATQKLKNDPRITSVGRIIRKTSIDELPQLLNVLKGDMSLVGPRPFMTSQAELYDGAGYYTLRPGLTGLWQVSDRNECDFVERVGFDDAYERDLSFATDILILVRTASVVARATGY